MTMQDKTGQPRDRANLDGVATLITLLHSTRRWTCLRRVLSEWDILQADVPSRERIEAAAGMLVGYVDSTRRSAERRARSKKRW